MAFNCPYCGHNAHSTAMYMTCEESSLCHQCGLSESDAWLRSQEDELVARFSTYSITPQAEQNPTNESKPMVKRIHFASAAAHSFPVSPYNLNGNQSMTNKANETAWVAETALKTYSPQPAFLAEPLESFDMHMDCELEISDDATTTTDSKRSSLNAGGNAQRNVIENSRLTETSNGCDVDVEISHAEPYMSLGYENDHGNDKKNLTRDARLPEEPSTGLPYTPCKDPIYNARSWWEYGGGRDDYRWDCLRERAM